ncbi:MAG: hypothetical protein GC162_20780 [Planctomycetes bacterium]|nr:hypothetical protein [Planctomycetota bacterium]
MAEIKKRQQFIALFEASQAELLRYLMVLLPQADDAADALQEAAVALWERFDTYESDKPFLPWAYRFAYHHALKHRAKAGRRVRMLSADVLEALADCVAKLSDDDQSLLQHRYARAITMQQLAADTGRNIHTIYKTLERIRRNLMDCVNTTLTREGTP